MKADIRTTTSPTIWPACFAIRSPSWSSRSTTPRAGSSPIDSESAWKKELTAIYRSERRNLGHVRFVREVHRPIARHDYGRPPHPGRLFYQRFQWVPFRHPRVDFTSPAEVSAAIVAFSHEGQPPRREAGQPRDLRS
jgi:hypothetical protein